MIIGLCGAAGSGKNTVADILENEHDFVQFGFADPVYAAVSAAIGIPVEQLRDRSMKESAIDWLGKSPRQLLQTLGTEWGRGMVREDIWVQIAIRRATGFAYHDVAITDVRFENEVAAIKEAGGVIWRVDRGPSSIRGDAIRHTSEAGIPDFLVDTVITNSSTIEHLAARVNAALERLPKATIEG